MDAHWLWLTEDDLKSVPLQAEDQPAYGVLTRTAWKCLREAAAARDDHAGYHVVLTCYNGQTVHAVAGGQQLFVHRTTARRGRQRRSRRLSIRNDDISGRRGTPGDTDRHRRGSAKYVVVDVHSRVNLLAGRADSLVGRDALCAGGELYARQLVEVRSPTSPITTALMMFLRFSQWAWLMLIGGMTFTVVLCYRAVFVSSHCAGAGVTTTSTTRTRATEMPPKAGLEGGPDLRDGGFGCGRIGLFVSE